MLQAPPRIYGKILWSTIASVSSRLLGCYLCQTVLCFTASLCRCSRSFSGDMEGAVRPRLRTVRGTFLILVGATDFPWYCPEWRYVLTTVCPRYVRGTHGTFPFDLIVVLPISFPAVTVSLGDRPSSKRMFGSSHVAVGSVLTTVCPRYVRGTHCTSLANCPL